VERRVTCAIPLVKEVLQSPANPEILFDSGIGGSATAGGFFEIWLPLSRREFCKRIHF
jgi:hypothetical protein